MVKLQHAIYTLCTIIVTTSNIKVTTYTIIYLTGFTNSFKKSLITVKLLNVTDILVN